MKRDFRLVVRDAIADAASFGWTGQGFFDSGAASTFADEIILQHQKLLKRAIADTYRDAASIAIGATSYASAQNILLLKAQEAEK